MKKILVLIVIAVTAINTNAQFTTATLQASGLTCAMCSKAISNSLQKLPFVESVKPDIKNSAFNIAFKTGMFMSIDRLKKAVQDAGFSVAKLKLTGDFSNIVVKNDEHVVINGNTFHFINVSSQTLNGSHEITIVDKNFLTAKEFHKYSSATQMSCIQTGQAASCCTKDGQTGNARVYHATI